MTSSIRTDPRLTTSGAAVLLGVSRQAVVKAILAGRLPATRTAYKGVFLIDRCDVDQLAARRSGRR